MPGQRRGVTDPGPSNEMKSADWEEVGNGLLRVANMTSPAAILLWQGHEILDADYQQLESLSRRRKWARLWVQMPSRREARHQGAFA